MANRRSQLLLAHSPSPRLLRALNGYRKQPNHVKGNSGPSGLFKGDVPLENYAKQVPRPTGWSCHRSTKSMNERDVDVRSRRHLHLHPTPLKG